MQSTIPSITRKEEKKTHDFYTHANFSFEIIIQNCYVRKITNQFIEMHCLYDFKMGINIV